MDVDTDLEVREMTLSEIDTRIAYFHESTDEHLKVLGVDRNRLPERAAWKASYVEDYARPIQDRREYAVAWLVDDELVGFSSADRIEFGVQAFMHLHIVKPSQRRRGLGVEAVRRSAAIYFDMFQLQRLLCEPNALNVAPNRTVQAAGFRYLYSHHTVPGPLNHPQVVTRWILDARPSAAPPAN